MSDKFIYYPELNDSEFYKKIYEKKEFYINKKKKEEKSYDDLCLFTKNEFELMEQQLFLKNFMSPSTPYKRILIFHGTGVGKTCTAIQIAEGFKNILRDMDSDNTVKKNKIYILARSDAQTNFIDELSGYTSKCTGNEYSNDSEINILKNLEKDETPQGREKYRKYKKDLESRIKKTNKGGMYVFLGYQSFQYRTIGKKMKDSVTGKILKNKEGKIKRKITEPQITNLDNCILIVDEAHQITDNDWGLAIRKIIKKSKNLRVVFLSATPMYHEALEIIPILNLLNIKQPTYYNEVFTKQSLKPKDIETDEKIKDKGVMYIPNWKKSTYTLTQNGLDIIKSRSRGYISYLRGYNPSTSWPNRKIMGEYLDNEGVSQKDKSRYTKVIKCPMSKFHYATYKHYYKGTMGPKLKHLINMVLPNPKDPKIGIFQTSAIDNLHKIATKKWLSENKLELIKDENHYIPDGGILKTKNLIKYSNKFVNIVETVNKATFDDSGIIFIYLEDIVGIGAKLLGNIFGMNGYVEYFSNKKEAPTKETKDFFTGLTESEMKKKYPKMNYSPAYYTILYGELDPDERNKLKKKINSPSNRLGKDVKIVIGSEVTKESITFLNIREIHIVNYQDNFSSIEQIIGRGIRHCSHRFLPKDKHEVKIFKYVTTLPPKIKGESSEEKEYRIMEKEHILIKKIERVLKESAIDCSLNIEANIIEKEVKKYKKCETKKNKTLCSSLCDYMPCEYTCDYTPDNTYISLKKLDKSTYTGFLALEEINKIIKIIQNIFNNHIALKLHHIINFIFQYPKTEYIEKKYIYLALETLIEDKILFEHGLQNKKKILGYIIYRGGYYIFQPNNKNENISLFYRNIPYEKLGVVSKVIDDYIKEKSKKKIKKVYNINLEWKNIANITKRDVLSRYLGKLLPDVQKILLEKLVKHAVKNKKLSKQYKKILPFFNNYLIQNKDLDSSLASSDDDDKNQIIGYYFLGEKKCFHSNLEIMTVCTTIKKKKIYKFNKKIWGFMDLDRDKKLKFKLMFEDKQLDNDDDDDDNSDNIDKRKKKRGNTCTTVKKIKLKKILKILDIQQDFKKNDELCKAIELNLRRRQRKELKKKEKDQIIWFLDYGEYINYIESDV